MAHYCLFPEPGFYIESRLLEKPGDRRKRAAEQDAQKEFPRLQGLTPVLNIGLPTYCLFQKYTVDKN
jgi:hypothetical protein